MHGSGPVELSVMGILLAGTCQAPFDIGESSAAASGAAVKAAALLSRGYVELDPFVAQVDLDKRIHRNQDTKALGRMSFVIMKTFLNRIEKLGLVDLKTNLFREMIQYNLIKEAYHPSRFDMKGHERQPIIHIPEYREKFGVAA